MGCDNPNCVSKWFHIESLPKLNTGIVQIVGNILNAKEKEKR